MDDSCDLCGRYKPVVQIHVTRMDGRLLDSSKLCQRCGTEMQSAFSDLVLEPGKMPDQPEDQVYQRD